MEKVDIKIGNIYALLDPVTYEIRYVGQTVQSLKRRLQEHCRDSRKYTHYTACWIKGLKAQGLTPLIALLESTATTNLNTLEIFWIKELRKTCKLTNLTDGGFGNNGQVRSAETNLKVSKTLREGIASGKISYVERSKLISQSKKGSVLSLSTREKLRQCNLGKKQSPEVILARTKNQGRKIIVNGEQFKSIREASGKLQVTENKLWRACNGYKVRNFNLPCSYFNEDIVESSKKLEGVNNSN